MELEDNFEYTPKTIFLISKDIKLYVWEGGIIQPLNSTPNLSDFDENTKYIYSIL